MIVRRSGVPIGPDTDIVIEGFARTGNTFAVTAFLHAQPGEVRVAHHVHAPGPLIAAVHRGLPALALIREPEAAVLSFVIRLPHLSLRQALRSYSRFYGPLVPYRRRIVVADLREVTTDFGAVTRRVNRMFGTQFAEFVHSEPDVTRVLETIDESDRSSFGSGEQFERSRARPSAWRDGLKESLAVRYRAPELRSLRHRAEGLYESLTRGYTKEKTDDQ